MKWTSSTFQHHLAFSQDGDDSSSVDLKTMMNVSEHRNFATLGQLHWVIDQTPIFVFIFYFNIFLAFTATLWSTLRFTKCRRFILQQNFCSAAWLCLIFVLASWFSRFLLDVTNTRNGERGTGNGEPGTGVWEQVYSGNPLENSRWRSKQKKRLEEEQFG